MELSKEKLHVANSMSSSSHQLHQLHLRVSNCFRRIYLFKHVGQPKIIKTLNVFCYCKL